METKFTDFTFKELFVLKSCIEDRINTLQSKKADTEAYLKFDIERGDDAAIEVFRDIATLVNEELEPLQIWRVQVLNAMRLVSDREIIQSN